MYQNKLFSLLSQLNSRELTSFQKHLSRHLTRQDISTKVFTCIRKYHPHFSTENVHPIALHASLFSVEPYNRNKILNTYSDIFIQLKEFLLIERIKHSPFEGRYLWISILKERGLEKECRKEAFQMRKEVQANDKKEVTDYLRSMEAFYYFTYLTNQSRRKPDVEALEIYTSHLDIYYAICRLKASCEMLNLNRQHSYQFPLETMPQLIDVISSRKSGDSHPLLLCYLEVYKLLETQDEQHFTRIEKLLSKNADRIAVPDLHTIISYLHNYATPKVRTGVTAFISRVHRLNVLALKYNVFSSKGAMSPSQFNNIIYIACTLKEFEWAERFLLKQGPYLEESIREVTVELAKATFYFEQGLYQQAIICLEGSRFREEHHVLRASVLTLMAYYDINPEYPLLDTIANNLEQYLYRIRNRMPSASESVLKFIRIFRILQKSELPQAVFIETIHQSGELASRDWFLSKARDYSPRFAARQVPGRRPPHTS